MTETSTEQAEREQAEAEQKHTEQVEKDMDADEFVVVAPYVTLKVKDQLGAYQIRGFNEGGGFKRDDVDEASLRHHLDTGLVVPVGDDRARFVGPAGTPKPGEPPNVPVTEQPVSTIPLAERLKLQAEAADKAQADAEKTEASARTRAGRQASAKADSEKSGG